MRHVATTHQTWQHVTANDSQLHVSLQDPDLWQPDTVKNVYKRKTKMSFKLKSDMTGEILCSAHLV